MRNDPLPSFKELHEHAKRLFGQVFEDDEARFVDAFLHGEYHEEETEFMSILDRLSDQELASLFLPVCKALIAGSADHRHGPTVKKLMDCFTALGKWHRKHLSAPEEILEPLTGAREVLFGEMRKSGRMWWLGTLEHFQLLEIGIRRRMGVSHLDILSIYGNFEASLILEEKRD